MSTGSGVSGSSSLDFRARLRRILTSSASAIDLLLPSGARPTQLGPVWRKLQCGIIFRARFPAPALSREHVAPGLQRICPVGRELHGASELHLRAFIAL